MFEISSLFNALITLLVTIDPPGLIPLFIGITYGMSRKERSMTALTAAIIACFILLFFALFGDILLQSLSISISAFQISGGILLFAIAFEMIFEKRAQRKTTSAQNSITRDHIRNIAAFPLAIPLIAGPGAISATILMSSKNPTLLGNISTIVVIIIAVFICYFFMVLSNSIDRLLGTTARGIVTRLFGVVLAALAVQFVADGLQQLIA